MTYNTPTPAITQRDYLDTVRCSLVHAELLPAGEVGLTHTHTNYVQIVRCTRADVLALADLIRESEAR